MAAHDVTTDRTDPPPQQGARPWTLVMVAMLALTWAGLVAGAVFALAPAHAAADLAVGLAWTVVVSALAGVAVSALYTLVFAQGRSD